jgi:PKD repeat protein
MSSRIAMSCVACLVVTSAAAVTAQASVAAGSSTIPRPDHVVVVVEENHSDQGIIGNPNAPYINSLASNGANMTSFFAETHPSEPNYLAMYSGDTQGITDDSCPHTFNAANLGGELLAAGLGFVGYSEDLPSVGYTGCNSGSYARKHNPWVNFTDVPSSSNQPFSAFPSDYSQLPDVSFVVPNLDNDMHDGSIAQGDQWLQDNVGGYVNWARTHNSLLVLTFDEDDHSQNNQIPTVFVGQSVAPGDYSENVNHYDLLRTLVDAYGIAPMGASASAAPIVDIWKGSSSGNQPPVAAFTSSCDALSCSFDGSSSTDSGGSLASYAWSFGDGGTSSGATAAHTYDAPGDYSVTLTVTDDQGATGSVSHAVHVSSGTSNEAFVSDGFDRSVTGGLGTADVGGPWTTVGKPDSFSVDAGVASLQTGPDDYLAATVGPAGTDADVMADLAVQSLPDSTPLYLSVVGRRVGPGNLYRVVLAFRPDGTLRLRLVDVVDGNSENLDAVANALDTSYQAGDPVSVRLQVVGVDPTVLRAKVWPSEQPEPADWQVTAVDDSAGLQSDGQVGLVSIRSSDGSSQDDNGATTVQLTAFSAQPVGADTAVGTPLLRWSLWSRWAA